MAKQTTNLNRIKIVLIEKGKDQQWLADKLGVGRNTVSNWCRGFSQPDLQTLKQISDLLKVDICDLLNK